MAMRCRTRWSRSHARPRSTWCGSRPSSALPRRRAAASTPRWRGSRGESSPACWRARGRPVLEVNIDTAGALQAISGMIRRIDHFRRVGIGAELSAWQVEDMHRHRPFTMRSRAQGRAATVVRPHSRYEVMRSRQTQRKVQRVLKAMAKPRARPYRGKGMLYLAYRRTSARAILRDELLAQLAARMREAMHRLLMWTAPDAH